MNRLVRVLISLVLVGCLIWSTVLKQKAEGNPDNEKTGKMVADAYFKKLDERGILFTAFINVGQGDAIFLRAPGGRTLLIDGGPSDNFRILSFFKQNGINRIDYVVSTHQDNDHLGGIVPVLQKLDIGKVLDNGTIHSSYTYERYLEILDMKKIPVSIVASGDRIDLGSGVHLMVLSQIDGADLKGNENSIVLKLVYGNVSMLFTGDIGQKAEKALVCSWGEMLDSDILKVPHHGSCSSSSEWFLNTVTPETAIISVGKNTFFGHPSDKIINSYKKKNVSVFRTDMNGTVAVFTNGDEYKVSTQYAMPFKKTIKDISKGL